MRNLILFLLLFGGAVLLLWSCDKPNSEKNDNYFKTYLLFERDGCKVYRFYDDGYIHYFTNCTETISTIARGTAKTRYTTTENIRGSK